MRLIFSFFFVSIFVFNKAVAQEVLSDQTREEFSSSILEFLENKNQELILELDSIKGITNSSNPISTDDIEILKRSKQLTKTIPLDYNDQVKAYIDKYTSKNYRPYMNRLLGLSKHYFSIYEPILKESGIPEEVKYLSLVESSLNPHLVSTSGAVGPWQFMYVAAKEFHLEMSGHIDERKDPYASTYAVSAYILDAYNQFGDWLVALASYNCGRGCVKRAIARSGYERPTFWELAPYLPQETKNYIPKYLAMTYVLSDPAFYDIIPDATELDLKHQVLFIDKGIDLQNVAKAIGSSTEELKKYNPSFKRNLVNGSLDKPKRLLLPITETVNDSLLYLALSDSKPFIESGLSSDESTVVAEIKKYKVKSGETMATVSRKFGVSVQNLRAWNDLNSKSKIIGKTLIVEKPVNEKLAKNVKTINSSKKSSSAIVYTVKKGDSLDKIANKYSGVSVSKLKADNGLKSNIIKPGMKLKISKGKG